MQSLQMCWSVANDGFTDKQTSSSVNYSFSHNSTAGNKAYCYTVINKPSKIFIPRRYFSLSRQQRCRKNWFNFRTSTLKKKIFVIRWWFEYAEYFFLFRIPPRDQIWETPLFHWQLSHRHRLQNLSLNQNYLENMGFLMMIKSTISLPECVFAGRIFLIIQNKNIYSYFVPYAAKHIYML